MTMELNDWLTQLSAELGTDDVELDHKTVNVLLDLARDAAHEVERLGRAADHVPGRRRRRAGPERDRRPAD